MDKKDYQTAIEACTSLATISTIQNKLNKLMVTTEDSQLKSLLNAVVINLNLAHMAITANKKTSIKTKVMPQEEPYKSLLQYCEQALKSVKPQWQLIAEQNGWSPK